MVVGHYNCGCCVCADHFLLSGRRSSDRKQIWSNIRRVTAMSNKQKGTKSSPRQVATRRMNLAYAAKHTATQQHIDMFEH